MGRTFLESGRKRICGGADVPNRREACPNRQIMPIPVRFCLLLFGVYDSSNCPVCTQSSRSLGEWTLPHSSLYLLLFESLPIIVRARCLTFYGFDFGELRAFCKGSSKPSDVYRQSESKMLVITLAIATLKAISARLSKGQPHNVF
jgi:hypothetical protein